MGKQKKMTPEERAKREARRLRRGRPKYYYEEKDILGYVVRERRIKEEQHGDEVRGDRG
jgi:hypothetical protein